MTHFNWTQLLPHVGHHYIHVATFILVGAGLILFSFIGRMALGRGEEVIAPAGTVSIKGFVESIIEFIIGLLDLVAGEHARKFAPMFASIFLFIWVNNLVGLIPGMTPATDNLNTTVAIGLFSFLVYNFYGLKENGMGYLKHFFGPVLFLAPLMFIIELISHGIRPMTLGLRLQGNMMADHTVLGIFLDLAPWGVPAIFYGMGIFVASMQAFVFTILSMIYISMATAHDH